jgi:23S rRNA G2445 N2-methylase RlmL
MKTILQLLAFCSLFVVSISFNQLNFVLLNKGSNRKLIFRSFSLPRRFFHVTTIEGHEKKLKDEIKSKVSDAKNIRIQKRGVSFEGSSRSGFESVLWLRTALKVMERIGSQQQAIRSKDDLYDYVQSINWDSIITVQNTIKCDAILSKYNADALNLTHSHFTALTIKNAIVDQFANSKNDQSYRPNVDKENPDLPIIFYMHMNEPFIYRAWSGELSMHKRGYKTNAIHKAGLKETTAAGM